MAVNNLGLTSNVVNIYSPSMVNLDRHKLTITNEPLKNNEEENMSPTFKNFHF